MSQWFTEDMFLIYLVYASYAKRLKTSVVAFDIVQFFLSLNHSMLTLILRHFGFSDCIIDFFSNYLVSISTQHSWNSFLFSICNIDVGVEQVSTLFPTFSALYIIPLIYIFELRV